jgi:hypothetical protein
VRLGVPCAVWVYPDECRPTIQRAAVLEGPAGVPASVIIKRIHWIDPYDPDDVRPTGGTSAPHDNPTMAWRLLSEWTATQCLTCWGGDPPLWPRCYGGDLAEGFVLLEDLGTGERLSDLLMGNDAVAAQAALLGYATALGRMHAATCGREAEYDRLWQARARRTTPMRQIEAETLRGEGRRLVVLGQGLGVRWPPGLEAEIETVVAAYREPGPFLALTVGDWYPANDMFVGGHLRLYDFERAAFRHALLDGFVKQHLFPWRRYRLQVELEQRFERIYRSELMHGCPAAADAEQYRRAALEMWAVWVLRDMGGPLEKALERDAHWEDDLSEAERRVCPTVRQRVLLVLDSFTEETEHVGHLEGMGAAARSLAERLRSLWQPAPCELQLFPAFAESRWSPAIRWRPR